MVSTVASQRQGPGFNCRLGSLWRSLTIAIFNIAKQIPSIVLIETEFEEQQICIKQMNDKRIIDLGISKIKSSIKITNRVCLSPPKDDRKCNI